MADEKDTQAKEENNQKTYSERQLVVFSLGNEEFGVDINEVNSIIKMVPITRIPNSQNFIEGVINLRGRIIVVVDLAKKLGLPGKERDKDSRIIVIETKENMIGMIVDHSREAIRISEDQIQPPPALITQKINSDYLEGVAIIKNNSKEQSQEETKQEDSGSYLRQESTQEKDSRLLILLDLAKVLSSGEMASVQQTQSAAPQGVKEQTGTQETSQQNQPSQQDNSSGAETQSQQQEDQKEDNSQDNSEQQNSQQ